MRKDVRKQKYKNKNSCHQYEIHENEISSEQKFHFDKIQLIRRASGDNSRELYLI